MNILITGGAGFIGSHLCRTLLDKGYRVICVDNLLTGSKQNISELLDNDRFTFIKHDITIDFQKIVPQLGSVNQIYHLASPASPVAYQKYPIETIHVNTLGTYFLLKLAYAVGAKFLFTSTSEVYGDPLEHPQKETYKGNVNSFGARSCYDESKRCGEAYVYTFATKFNVDTRIVRIFNTYGPRMEKNDGRVISNFVNQAIGNQPITIQGEGNQTRSFCYVSDMVEGIIRAMEAENTKSEVINLGNTDERTVNEIADLIIKLSGSTSKKSYKELPSDDPARRQPDITKAKTLLGWEPKVQLDEGLKKTITYFKEIIHS